MKNRMNRITLFIVSLIMLTELSAQRVDMPTTADNVPIEAVQNKPFYMVESDSVAKQYVDKIRAQILLEERQVDKMVRLRSQEYEEQCRNIHIAVISAQMSGADLIGLEPTTNVGELSELKSSYIEIEGKYLKRYAKILTPEQLEVLTTLRGEGRDYSFKELYDRVVKEIRL